MDHDIPPRMTKCGSKISVTHCQCWRSHSTLQVRITIQTWHLAWPWRCSASASSRHTNQAWHRVSPSALLPWPFPMTAKAVESMHSNGPRCSIVFRLAKFILFTHFWWCMYHCGEGVPVHRCGTAETRTHEGIASQFNSSMTWGLSRLNSPGVIFDDKDSIQAWKEPSVLLCNVVKPKDISDPISVGECASSFLPLFEMFNTKVTSKAEHLLVTLCFYSIPWLR